MVHDEEMQDLSPEQVDWGGLPLRIVSKKGLIKLKHFRNSKQDLADIEKLEESDEDKKH